MKGEDGVIEVKFIPNQTCNETKKNNFFRPILRICTKSYYD